MEQRSCVPSSSVVGGMTYAMICNRRDISQAVNVASRYMGNAGKTHWHTVRWIRWYSKGATGGGLIYGVLDVSVLCVVGYVDSGYAGDLNKEGHGQYVFTLCGRAISWSAW